MENKPTASELLARFKCNLKLREGEAAAVEENKQNPIIRKAKSDQNKKEEPTRSTKEDELDLAITIDENDSTINNNSDIKEESLFYENAQKYWSEVPATVNGMLGGLGYISSVDIEGSSAFLHKLELEQQFALDCGAGIGRVSKDLLLPRFLKVDMVEQDPAFANKAREYCSELYGPRIGEIYNVGLQQFTPDINKYDLIWSQWVLGHLTDVDLSDFFQRVKYALHQHGYFIIKENVTSSGETEIDETDSSVTRPLKDYERILRNSGFRVTLVERQMNLPKGLYPVYMIASKRIQ